MDNTQSDNNAAGWPFASGEMAQRIRSHDWGATPLGPSRQWPPVLRAMVNLILQSPRMMALSWGEQALLFFNDAYARLIGPRSAIALGRSAYETFADFSAIFEPHLCSALAGRTVELKNQYYPFIRTTGMEDAWFDQSHHPVYLDDGCVAGVLSILEDNTPRVLAERDGAQAWDLVRRSAAREVYLLRLSDALRPLSDPAAVMAQASRVLGEQLGATRVLYGEVSADGTELIVEHNFVAGAAPVLAGRFQMADFGASLVQALAAGTTVAVSDIAAAAQLSASERGSYAALGIAALVGVPLVKGGQFVAILNVHHAAAHAWTPTELTLIEETAQRTWAAVQRARVEGALRLSEERMRALTTATADAIYHMSPDWSEMRALQGRGFLADTREPTTEWLQQYIEPPDHATVQQAIEDAIRRKAVFELEHRVRRADGSIGWTLSRAVPLLDGQGEIREWVGAASDITDRKRAEDARRESEAQLRAIANLVPDLLWRSDAQGNVQWYSKRWYEYTGQSLQGAQGQGWADVVHPEDLPRTLQCWREAAQTAQPYMREHRLRRHDGEYRWFLTRAEPLRGRDGQVTLWFGSATDIHEQRGAREMLQERVVERTQALRQLLLHFEALQDEERRRIARELHDSLGQYLSSVTLAISGLKNAASDPAAHEKLERLHALMQQLDQELDRIIFVLRPTALEDCGLGDGVAAYVQTWSMLTGVAVDMELRGLEHARLPAPVEAAVFRVVQEALTNVAKYAQATRVSVSLARRRGQLLGTIEDDGIGFEATDATALTAGRANWGLLGMQERIEALGGSFTIESHPGAGTTVLWRVPLALQTAGALADAGRDGAVCSVAPLPSQPSDPQDTRGPAAAPPVAQTLLGRLAQAEEAVRARDDFLAIAGHELRSPMNALSLQLQAIERLLAQGHGTRAAEELRRARRILQRFVQRATVLLDVSRLNAGRSELSIEPVDVRALVDRVLDAYAPEAAIRGAPLRAEVESGLTAHWDPHRIEEILCNLVTNAIKYGDGTAIKVAAARNGADRICLTVADGGPGIPAAHRARIFEKFERVVGVPGKSSGFGVGLWLVGRIVDAHGGLVEIDVGARGGTTFRVKLPVFATTDRPPLAASS